MTQLSKCSPLPRRQPRTRNYPRHAPLVIISGRVRHVYDVVHECHRHKNTPAVRHITPRSHSRSTGYIIVSILPSLRQIQVQRLRQNQHPSPHLLRLPSRRRLQVLIQPRCPRLINDQAYVNSNIVSKRNAHI